MYKALRIAFAGASFALSSSAHAEWRRYETEHFIIYSEAGEAKATKRATDLEKIDGLLRLATGLSSDVQPVKVRIYELGTERDVQAAMGDDAGAGLAGFYSSNILGPYAVTERSVVMGEGKFTPDLVLHHEYTHHFMLQYFPAEYPLWYAEGFAELIGASKMLDDGRVAYGFPARYRGNYLAVGWVPVDQLLARPPDKAPPYNVYGQGWAMTHFFTFNKARSPQLTQYLMALAAGRSRPEAAKVFGDLSALNREAHDYVARGVFEYRPVAVRIQEPVVRSVTPVGPAEAALIPETAAFKDFDVRTFKKESDRQQQIKARVALLDRIRRKAANYPNDPYALYLLAEAENSSGSKAAAEGAVDRLLIVQPGNVRGLVRKSMLMSEAAGKLSGQERLDKAAQARALAVRANKADSNEPLTYVAYYDSYRAAGQRAPADAVQGLEAAVEKLPDNASVRRMLVEEYADEHRWRAAIQTLGPIANDPHDSPLRAEARERMTQLQSRLKAEGGTSAVAVK